jgi:elongation factor P
MNTGDISVGSFIRHEGELVQITEYQHRTPGNLRAFYQAKMRVLRTGKIAEYRFRSGESVDIVRVELRTMQYLYKENTSMVLMDPVSYEQIYIDSILFGDSLGFLKENIDVVVAFADDSPIFAEPPRTMALEITYTEPGIRGDTATRTLKQATVETGATVNVPLFCNIGDMIKVDTKTGDYVERVTK